MGRGKNTCKSKVRNEKAGYVPWWQISWYGSKVYLKGAKLDSGRAQRVLSTWLRAPNSRQLQSLWLLSAFQKAYCSEYGGWPAEAASNWRCRDQFRRLQKQSRQRQTDKQTKPKKTIAMLGRCPSGLQAGLCSFEAFLCLLCSKPAWVTELWQTITDFAEISFRRSLVFHDFWKYDSYSWHIFPYPCNISLKCLLCGVKFRKTPHGLSWSRNNHVVLWRQTPSQDGVAAVGLGRGVVQYSRVLCNTQPSPLSRHVKILLSKVCAP